MTHSGTAGDKEITVFLDTIPALIGMGNTQLARDYLQELYRDRVEPAVERWGHLPPELVHIRHFEPLSTQARSLCCDGYFTATVALCGMAAEALCISVAEDRVLDLSLKAQMTDPPQRCWKEALSFEGLFQGAEDRVSSASSARHKK